MKNFIKIYLKYLFGNNMIRILFFYAIVIYIFLDIKIDIVNSFRDLIIYYFGYSSIYFFNDYIDRERDIKKKFIDLYKISLNKKTLIILGIIHLTVPTFILLFLKKHVLLFLLLFSILIGILRSFLSKKDLREISLIFLIIVKLISVYYIVYKTLEISFPVLLLFICISFIYSASYFSHRYFLEERIINKKRKIIYFVIYLFLSIISAILIFFNLNNILLSIFIIFYYLLLVYFIKFYSKKIKDMQSYNKFINSYALISIFLLIFVISLRTLLIYGPGGI